MKLVSKFCGACAAERDHEIAAAVVLDLELILEGRLRGAAQRRQLRLERELGRQVLGERHRDRQASSRSTAPLAVTVRFCVPIAAFAGTSRRSCSEVLSLVATIAAATGWPPPSSVDGPALRHAADRQREAARAAARSSAAAD